MIFFYIILVLLGLFSFFVISSRNPIHSALALITVFLLASVLLFCLEVEFLALSFVIVYVGAIAVLFLFVVMMLDVKIGDSSLDFLTYVPLGYFISFTFILEIILPSANLNSFPNEVSSINYNWINWIAEIDSISNIQAIGQLLYTYYFVFFLMAGFILFVAILGALMLTLTLNKSVRRSVYFKQKMLISS
jgi:NADH-quinone oxidoreductase subunit J|tara:strand:+ start:5422 stop:5994 length:573 start_codon:yes stop_codon:yes gene_type:complete